MPTISRRSALAFLYAVPISLLGGLMGLGGAEFRLPVLAGPLGYKARQAVPLNLAVSLVTMAVSLQTWPRLPLHWWGIPPTREGPLSNARFAADCQKREHSGRSGACAG